MTPLQIKSGRHSLPVLAIGAFVGAMAIARLTAHWQLPLPPCLLRKFTGLPCPSCGCTRSLLAWSHLDLAQAFFFNPLFFVYCVAGLLWAALLSLRPIHARSWLDQWRSRAARWPVGRMFLILVALNWLYLCLCLPK